MYRAFDEHVKRNVKSLNGIWKMKKDENNVGIHEGWCCGFNDGVNTSVPSVWNSEFGMLSYEGVVWYQNEFYTSGGCLRFVFEGVMTDSIIYLDGNRITAHYGGFDAFDVIVPDVKCGYHILVVRVDNTFDSVSIPQAFVDWYHYGGIIRSVSVETLNGVSVLNQRFEYTLNRDLSDAICYINLDLYNASRYARTSNVSIFINNERVTDFEISLESGEYKTIKSPEFMVGNLMLWSTDNPKLYNILVTTESDDLYDRIGFRKIEVHNAKILLNGKELELKGVNRHEEYPDFGFAFPTSLMQRDIDIIKDLGCNSIRGSHYPNSKIFLDMLDEAGILFWSEIPIWGCGFTAEAIGNDTVIERGAHMLINMVKQYYNHPAIIIWGMHNEIPSNTDNGLKMTKEYHAILKDIGGNRLITYASHIPLSDICLSYCDVISINQYLGWYGGEISEWDGFIEKFRNRRKELGLENIPVIMSEFGAAALYGHHTFDDVHWTEEYQAKLFKYTLDLFMKDPMIIGYYAWQFCDIRTCLEAGINRARGFNNKGLLNEHRKPKQAYFAVKNAYTGGNNQ